jgi:hypothetical protein
MRTLEQIWALVQVQILTLLNTMRYQQGRGGLKVSIAIASLWYGFWTFAAVGAAMLPRLVGAEDIETVLPGVLLFIMAYWQLTPLLTLSLGVSLHARKLTIYPVSLGTLFAVECLLRLGTGAEMSCARWESRSACCRLPPGKRASMKSWSTSWCSRG